MYYCQRMQNRINVPRLKETVSEQRDELAGKEYRRTIKKISTISVNMVEMG